MGEDWFGWILPLSAAAPEDAARVKMRGVREVSFWVASLRLMMTARLLAF